jgi:predicted ATPase
MKFYFKKIGTLQSAEVELGKFTVICGNNNTSKTIICNAIYGFLKHMRSSISSSLVGLLPKNVENETEFKIDLKNIIPKLKKNTEKLQIKYNKELNQVFDVDVDFVVNTSVSIDLDSIDPNFSDDYSYSIGDGVISADREKDSSIIEFSIYPKSKDKKKLDIKKLSASLLFHACYFTMFPNPSIMTSERSGIVIFQKELDSSKNSIVDGLKGNEDKKILQNISRYAISIRDNISTVRDAAQLSKQKSFLPVELIEYFCSIVEGKYVVDSRGVMFETSNKENEAMARLPMHYSSSSVKALFLLHVYLVHTATPNDIIIIDEPELSLHPDNQRKLLRLLARLCNCGIRIFITTHSDFFIKELNNLIMIGELAQKNQTEICKKLSYNKNEIINRDDVKAYFINKHAVTIPIIDKFGIDIETFNKEIDTMNRTYDTISGELYE